MPVRNPEDLPELEERLARAEGERSRERVDLLNELAWTIGVQDIHRTGKLADEAIEIGKGTTFAIRLPVRQSA